MNLFENLQIMNESVNDEFVKQECEKYGFNKPSYGSGYMELYLEPSDKSAEEFIKKIEADGYKFIEEQKDGLKNTISENDVTLVYGKEVGENRCIIAVVIHPSEDYVIATCGYNEDESDNEFFENLQALKESDFNKDLIINMVKDGFETGHPYIDYEEFSQDEEIGDINAAWEFYNKLINLGPAGFYNEYYDELEFSDDYKAEYGSEEPHINDETDNAPIENKLSSQYIRGPVYPKPEGDGPKAYWTLKINALDKSKDEPEVFTTYIFCMDKKHAMDYMAKTYPNASIQEVESIGSYTAEQTGEPIINLTNKKSVNESAILKDDKDVETVVEQKIIKDEKDIEQVVEGTQTLTEDSDNILDLVEAKSKRFGHMVDALGEEMPTSEINDFLKGLTTELDMDIYEGDKPYPTDLAGYFGQPVDELDINNSDDLEMINWIDGILTTCIDKMNDFINSRIETLRGEISAIEGDIARLEMVL